MTEGELAIQFVNYFRHNGYDVFQEVKVGGGRIDIVATDGHIIIGCEVKTTASLKVVEQAWNNIKYCHYSYIAVPTGSGSRFFDRILEKFHIGKLECNDRYCRIEDSVHETVNAQFHRKVSNKIKLHEFSKESEAGTTNFMTPFKQTIRSIVQYAGTHPDCKFSEALKHIPTHYRTISTAKSSIMQWVKRGIIKEFTVEDGKIILVKNEM